jgi:hypothetical protein
MQQSDCSFLRNCVSVKLPVGLATFVGILELLLKTGLRKGLGRGRIRAQCRECRTPACGRQPGHRASHGIRPKVVAARNVGKLLRSALHPAKEPVRGGSVDRYREGADRSPHSFPHPAKAQTAGTDEELRNVSDSAEPWMAAIR